MPTPSARNTATVSDAGCASAKPSAAPMNGAVHGDATTTASTPVPNASSVRLRDVQPRTDEGATLPNSNTPDRLRPITKNRSASSDTNSGDWSWKPQPSCSLAVRNAMRASASPTNVASTPAPYASPSRRIVAGESWCSAKPSTLIDSTGSTQGIRFRTAPPTNASTSASRSDIDAPGADDVMTSVGAFASTGFGPATTAPASGTSIVAAFASPIP